MLELELLICGSRLYRVTVYIVETTCSSLVGDCVAHWLKIACLIVM